ncbi:hypothetical protein [Nocardia sp. CY41]|uniref:hypothetical protein n=1 Tax=Nocardia sp. CY41 TaxID=2608686 RepID=UPI00135B4CE1|nr:hypothetical protein [Nocardia sp. CY41]
MVAAAAVGEMVAAATAVDRVGGAGRGLGLIVGLGLFAGLGWIGGFEGQRGSEDRGCQGGCRRYRERDRDSDACQHAAGLCGLVVGVRREGRNTRTAVETRVEPLRLFCRPVVG